ncbi:hypothetical protein BJV78DRAFT_868062 [Lactifluus subvellereus]|nr:hypothetical protein BJV78DRAFT_868062 [Lactifluus subvellereus]
MPLTRCRNFDENGSRKTRSNGTEMLCRPHCSFIHPSDRDWDRARPATVRGRGGPPHGGRGRGQSSSGVVASGANAHSLGSERTSSSGTWEDYVTGFGSNSPATSSAKGPSLWSSQATPGTSGWGDAGASGSGWGSNANNNVGASDGWSSEPAVTGANAPPSQWDSQSAEWGSSGNGWSNFGSTGWGSAGTDHGAGWGQDPNSDQGDKAPIAAAVQNAASPPDPDAQSGGGWTNDNPDAATSTTLSSQAIQPVITSKEPDQAHSEHRGEDTSVPAMVNPLPLGHEASPTASLEQPLSANPINEPQMRPLLDDNDGRVIPTLLGSEMSRMMLYLTVTLKMRKLKAELLQFSALRKSRQLPKLAVEAEHRAYSRWLPQSDSLGLPVGQLSTTHPRENTQFDQLKDWITRAEGCLGHVQAEQIPISPAKDLICQPVEAANREIRISGRDSLAVSRPRVLQYPFR